MKFCITILLTFSLSLTAQAQQLAFPGAEGFGRFTSGGRGGQVLIVTNLNDSGPGSLRAALEAKFPRTIVFEVSGTIALQSELEIQTGDLTVAGQTAPGDGITVRNFPIKVKAGNVILRYIRSRMGDSMSVQDDAISAVRQQSLIIDHCSFSWATDECASFYDNEFFTLQYCIIAESLNNSVHQKGEHGYGGIWGGRKATFHHNLLAHHKSRNPRFNGARYHKQPAEEVVDFRNNVIYNWEENNSYGGEEGNHNMIGNFYKAGPATLAKTDKILDPFKPYGKFYLSGNVLFGNEKVTSDNSKGIYGDTGVKVAVWMEAPLEVAPVTTQTAYEAYETVLEAAGASKFRDAVDERIIHDVKSGTASAGQGGIIDTPEQAGGWPELLAQKAPKDTDRDGMPDTWEKAHGLDPQNDDSAGLGLDAHYTNLEVYLNELAAD